MLLVFGLVLGLAAIYAGTQEPRYTATSVVLLKPVPGSSLTPEIASTSGTQITIAMTTEARTVTTPAVAALASDEAGRPLGGDDGELAVRVLDATQTLEIAYTGSSPQDAQSGAQAYADAFLEYRGTAAAELQEGRIDSLNTQAEAAQESLREATSAVGGFAQQQVQLFTDRLAQLNANLSAEEVVSTDPGSVLNPADEPTGPDGVPTWLLLVLAAAVGGVLAVLAALFREWRQDVVRSEEDFSVSGLPVFASVPQVKHEHDEEGLAHVREAFRQLRAGVVANCPRPHVLVVSGVGKNPQSLVGPNLGISLADAGFSVLVVDADAHAAGLHTALGVEASPGLSELLGRKELFHDAVRSSHGIDVLPIGHNPAAMRDLQGGPALRDLVSRVRSNYDYVIFNTAPSGTADSDAAMSAAESVLLVVVDGQTTRAQIEAALDRQRHLGIVAAGLVNVRRDAGMALALPRSVDDAHDTPAATHANV
ncbi:AAA family ATPase [uncultured Serinicoccus sp.]|uniref:AAA family ATPase n=1 Tax=uncultured Serinicoccus sp. TaxID=735514 RepID=UPI0026317F6F|nr:AAA family ATPase [uncultured Serinicoccus sp.]